MRQLSSAFRTVNGQNMDCDVEVRPRCVKEKKHADVHIDVKLDYYIEELDSMGICSDVSCLHQQPATACMYHRCI